MGTIPFEVPLEPRIYDLDALLLLFLLNWDEIGWDGKYDIKINNFFYFIIISMLFVSHNFS